MTDLPPPTDPALTADADAAAVPSPTAARRPRRPLLAALLLANLAAAAGLWYQREARWLGELYCFEHPQQVWSAAPLPAGATPECPASDSYRQEVRERLGRVEQFRLSGWQPQPVLQALKAAGFRAQTDDQIAPGNYAAFLVRGTERLQYSAVQEGETTLVTVSGPPPQRP